MHNCIIRLTTEFRKHQEMGQVLSIIDAAADSPAQTIVAASGAFSADHIILMIKVVSFFIFITMVACSIYEVRIWRSFSSASPNAENPVSSSSAGPLESTANQDGGIPNTADALLQEAGILMNNLLASNSANYEGSTDNTGVPVPTIVAAIGANHNMIELASLALSI